MDSEVKLEPMNVLDYDDYHQISATTSTNGNSTAEGDYSHHFQGKEFMDAENSFGLMQSLLHEWGLEVLAERFTSNLIEVKLLEHMIEKDIETLCEGFPMRYKIVLRQKIKEGGWKPVLKQYERMLIDKDPTSIAPIPATRARSTNQSDKAVQVDIGPKMRTQQSLIEICQQYEPGRRFLEIYQAKNGKNNFNAECRDLIKKSIVDHFFALGRGTLSVRDFAEMCRIILAELPNEDPHIWYINRSSKFHPSGLLYSRYRQLQSKANQHCKKQQIPKGAKRSATNIECPVDRFKHVWEDMPEEQRDACMAAKLFLRNVEAISKDDVETKWKQSFHIRRYEAIIETSKLEEWEVLRYHDNVQALVTYDFCVIHSPNNDKIQIRLTEFVNRFKNVYQQYRGSINDDKELTAAIWSTFMEANAVTERAIFLALYALPLILRTNFIVSGKKRTKPSIMESRHAFITVIEREKTMAKLIAERHAKDVQSDGKMNPLIIAIGSISEGIEKYHVVLDHDLVYPCGAIGDAVDLLFKLYTTFNIDYPQRCELVWKFIQAYLYEIDLTWDKTDPSVAALITDFNRSGVIA